jgi:hypothetical protein
MFQIKNMSRNQHKCNAPPVNYNNFPTWFTPSILIKDTNALADKRRYVVDSCLRQGHFPIHIDIPLWAPNDIITIAKELRDRDFNVLYRIEIEGKTKLVEEDAYVRSHHVVALSINYRMTFIE